jgi:hypothetical protein
MWIFCANAGVAANPRTIANPMNFLISLFPFGCLLKPVESRVFDGFKLETRPDSILQTF